MDCCKAFTLFLIPATLISTVFGQKQEISLHTNYRGTGDEVVVIDRDEQDLSRLSHKKFYTVSVTGVWIFYEHKFFNEDQGGVVYFNDTNNKVFHFPIKNGKLPPMLSIRHAGHWDDLKRSSITFYQFKNFQGPSQKVDAIKQFMGNPGRIAKSLIITGKNSWMISDQPNSEGHRWCIEKSGTGPLLIPDMKSLNPRIPFGTIKSVVNFCSGKYTKLKLE